MKLLNQKYSVTIRNNALTAVAMLTYHEVLYNELINENVIDVIMELCIDPKTELSIKKYSSMALVHFVLNPRSLDLLLEKGVMDLFSMLTKIDNEEI